MKYLILVTLLILSTTTVSSHEAANHVHKKLIPIPNLDCA